MMALLNLQSYQKKKECQLTFGEIFSFRKAKRKLLGWELLNIYL